MKHAMVYLMGLLMFGLAGASALAEEAYPDTITVSGSAEMEAEPDYIAWELTLTENHIDPVQAKQRVDKRYELVLDIAGDLDIEGGDVILGHVSISKTFEREFQGGPSKFKDYRVRRTVTLLQRDLEAFDEMLEKLTAARVEFDIHYQSSKVFELKRAARLEAMRQAKKKAQEMAGVLDRGIGRPLRIEEYGTNSGFDLRDSLSNSSTRRPNRDGDSVRRGAISVRCEVEVAFRLTEK